MMQKVITAYKKIGETPLDVIKKLKTENSELSTEKMAYAGRLDPMAEGLLLILVGDACKKRKDYEKLNKTYEFEVLFGIATDTYDVLGKIVKVRQPDDRLENELIGLIPSLIGKKEQSYPPFSSARVNGKPLFYWAREGKINTIKIPKKEIEIYSIKINSVKSVTKDFLTSEIKEKLNKIKGEFRQEDINRIWDEYFLNSSIDNYKIAKLTVNCSSGTYVRSLANNIGKKLGTNAIALSIKRTAVGEYTITKS